MPDFDSLSTEGIRAHRETVFLRQLIRLAQIETATLVTRLHERGHGAVQRAHVTMLGNIDTEGTRLVELARRLGVTRQAISQMVTEIESRGFVVREPDPDDGRAIRVRHTPAGKKMLVDALELMHEIESGYARMVGVRKFAEVKDVLRALADTIDPATAL